jgi:hypothetical protein
VWLLSLGFFLLFRRLLLLALFFSAFFTFRLSFSPPVRACIFLRAFFSFLFFPLLLASPLSVGFLLNFLPFWGSGREGVLERWERFFFVFPTDLMGVSFRSIFILAIDQD